PKTRRSAAKQATIIFFIETMSPIKMSYLTILQEIRINDNKLGLEKQSLYQDCLQIQVVI
ncbi:hypothetical protein, partial [Streptococcus salivarius]|uniref:hypothetical protein n=1 Tax=Streptococcus salivarius TaxID=1304 RepID=UPI0032EC5DA9